MYKIYVCITKSENFQVGPRNLLPQFPYSWDLHQQLTLVPRRIGRVSWTEETGGLQSMGSQRVRHNWAHISSLLCWHNFTSASMLHVLLLGWSDLFLFPLAGPAIQFEFEMILVKKLLITLSFFWRLSDPITQDLFTFFVILLIQHVPNWWSSDINVNNYSSKSASWSVKFRLCSSPYLLVREHQCISKS